MPTPGFFESLAREQGNALYELARAVEARRWAAHPWRF
jgi:hypothetical protein